MQRKMYVIFSIIVVASILFSGLLSHLMLQKNYLDGIQERLTSNGRVIEDLLPEGDKPIDGVRQAALRNISRDIQTRITLIAQDGTVLYDSEEDASKMENHSDREEVKKALLGSTGISRRHSATLDSDLYYLALPSADTGAVKVVRLAVPLKSINAYERQMLMNLLVSSVTGLLITMMIGYRLLDSVFRPIKDLKDTAKRITEGKYAEKVNIHVGDEVGELAKAFNQMTDELNVRIKEVNDQNSKMNAILSNMLSVVLAVDREKRVMLMNKEAEELFEVSEEEAKGRYILEIFRSSSVLGQIKDLIETNQPSMAEIEVEGSEVRVFNVYANPIQDFSRSRQQMGIVMIFQEITEIRKLENMRKDFVANVSHELKTPLTSIKGFVETLKNGAVDNPAVRDRFLDIIEMEAMRLTHLINDLLVLSDIEKTYEHGEKEPLRLNAVIEEVVVMLSDAAGKKDIELITMLDDRVPLLYGNPNWMKQMLINLVDNGIKYTPNTGYVKISTSVELGHINLIVEDNGIGIAKEHTDRLFERFYRVDKARSRNVGGTGLGLAIVKHIVLAFKGDIKVHSEVDRGTSFQVRIPIQVNSYKQYDAHL